MRLPTKPTRYFKQTAAPFWRSMLDLFRVFKQCFKSKSGGGSQILFWHDYWFGETTFKSSFPLLYSFAQSQNYSVPEFIFQYSIDRNFRTPLTSMQSGNLKRYPQSHYFLHLEAILTNMLGGGIAGGNNSF